MSAGIIVAIVAGALLLLGGCVGVGALVLVARRAETSTTSSYSPSYGGGGSTSSGGGIETTNNYDTTYEIGDRVKVDDSTWTVLDVKDMGSTIFATSEWALGEKKTTTGRFIRIHYKVENDAKRQETLLDVPVIVDSRDREFGPIQGESEYVPRGTKTAILETIQPSMEKDFYTIIEVPADASDLEIELTGLGLVGSKKQVATDL
jgi:hypothetical protein